MSDKKELSCFKPLSHRGEDKPAELFLRNKRGTLVPMCEPCYGQFVKTCEGISGKDNAHYPEEWLSKPESERKVTVGDGMEEFLQQERARQAGEREGPAMASPEEAPAEGG